MDDKKLEEKINRLSMMEQNIQYISSQRQSFQNQLVELDSAIEELKTSEEAYKIVSNIMVKTNKESLNKELDEKKKTIKIKVESIEKQESSVKEKADKLREEVMKGLKKGD